MYSRYAERHGLKSDDVEGHRWRLPEPIEGRVRFGVRVESGYRVRRRRCVTAPEAEGRRKSTTGSQIVWRSGVVGDDARAPTSSSSAKTVAAQRGWNSGVKILRFALLGERTGRRSGRCRQIRRPRRPLSQLRKALDRSPIGLTRLTYQYLQGNLDSVWHHHFRPGYRGNVLVALSSSMPMQTLMNGLMSWPQRSKRIPQSRTELFLAKATARRALPIRASTVPRI